MGIIGIIPGHPVSKPRLYFWVVIVLFMRITLRLRGISTPGSLFWTDSRGHETVFVYSDLSGDVACDPA